MFHFSFNGFKRSNGFKWFSGFKYFLNDHHIMICKVVILVGSSATNEVYFDRTMVYSEK